MRNIARLSDNDRRELFRNTADKMGLNDAIVEKDFWVCFTLDYLFHRSPWKESITFKGCLLYTSPSPRDLSTSRMPSSA